MVAVIVAAYLVTKYISKRGGHAKSRHMRILDRMMLGKDKHIVLIEIGDRNLLIGVTNLTINILGDIEGETLGSGPQESEGSAQKGFMSQMRDFFINMKDAPGNLNKARMEARKPRDFKAFEEDDFLSRMDDAIQRRKDHIAGQDKEGE
jgi:flagellar biosynthetic protein FliO